MDDVLGLLVVVLLAGWLGGLIVGLVALSKARRALAEIAMLRVLLARDVPPPVAEPASPWADLTTAPVPEPGPEPAAGPVFVPPPPPKKRRDIEELLTLRWGVWLGAAALVLSGVFLVRYAVDQGLLGPATRCGLMVVLSMALVAAAEFLRRRPARPSAMADHAPAALAAGGVAILFGAGFAAAVLYELVPPPIGFALMAASSIAGLALSLRMGQLVAAVGIVGAFVTPLLVHSDAASLPGLFAYLLFVAASGLAVVRYTAWTWLGWGTTLACALWVAVAAISGETTTLWAPALFVPAAAALNLTLLPPSALDHPVGRRLAWVPFAALAVSGLFLLLVTADPFARAGVLLLAPIAVAKGARESRLDRLPWLAALFYLLVLLAWGLPEWQPTGETIAVTNVVQAILPGDWAPAVLVPLLETAALMAAFFAAAGLWFERRAAHPVRWAALPGAVPLLALAITYTRVRQFQPDAFWAASALGLAALLTGAATWALKDGDRQRAGVHAAGATASLALGFSMLLSNAWLTLAVALLLPALAWIAAQADLPALRRVALALAGLVLIRLLLNWYVLDYAVGQLPFLNALLPAYLVPAISFAVTARLFRARAEDRVVTVLEAGSFAFATVLVALEIRQWATGGLPGMADTSFLELALHVAALSVQARLSLALAQRSQSRVPGWAWQVQGALALIGGALLILLNPMVVPDAPVGQGALLLAYAVPGALAASAVRHPRMRRRGWLSAYALVAVFAWITLEIRYVFHPGQLGLDAAPVADAELWAWSGAWLAFGLVLMAVGIRLGVKQLRLAALAVVAVVGAKAFLIDMAGLVGLWRVLSFLGLGLTLIGLGAVYRRFVADPLPPA
jgi:uncharacterized membrane protein